MFSRGKASKSKPASDAPVEPDKDHDHKWCGVREPRCMLYFALLGFILMIITCVAAVVVAVFVAERAVPLLNDADNMVKYSKVMMSDFYANRYNPLMDGVKSTLDTTGSEAVRNLTLSAASLGANLASNATDVPRLISLAQSLIRHIDLLLLGINTQGGLFGSLGLQFNVPISFAGNKPDPRDTDSHSSEPLPKIEL